MSFIWVDSFAFYSTSAIDQRYTPGCDGQHEIDATGGRDGRGMLSANHGGTLTLTLPSTGSKLITQFALMKRAGKGALGCDVQFYANDVLQGRIEFSSRYDDNNIEVYDASDSLVGATNSYVYKEEGVFHSIEIRINSADSGQVDVRLDQRLILSLSGDYFTDNGEIDSIVFSRADFASGMQGFSMSDLVISDVSTGDDSFLGDLAVAYSEPTADVLDEFYVIAFTDGGSGLDDLSVSGLFSGAVATNYVVEIDASGTPDTFKWSNDGGSTWTATGVAITGDAQTLNNGVTVFFGATTGHSVGDKWSWTSTEQFSKVDEITFAGTDMLQTSRVGQKQLFQNAEAYDATYEPLALQQVLRVNLTSGGTGVGLLPTYRFEGVDYNGVEVNTTSPSPKLVLTEFIATNLNTGAALSLSDVNSLIFGLEVDDS